MSRTKSLYNLVIGLGLLCVATPLFGQQHSEVKLAKELTKLTPQEDILNYKFGTTTLAKGKLINGLKSGKWESYYATGTLKSEATFSEGKLHGHQFTYYENGQKMCSSHFNTGLPSEKWISHYLNGNKQGEITWFHNNLPKEVVLYYRNNVVAFEKTFEYAENTVTMNVKSYYENKIGFEEYTLDIALDEFKEHLFELTLDTRPNLLVNETGLLTGFYKRKYNSGKTWVNAEFYSGKLLEVLEQNTPSGSPIESWREGGTGTLIHFHHFSDTAAVINYSEGYKNGKVKFFHKNNNRYKTGYYQNNQPTGEWSLFSESGKIRQKLTIENENSEWTFYGPKNKREALYNLKNLKLEGTAYRFNFFGDTSAVFQYQNGLLDGKFTKFQWSSPLRSGKYLKGEQIGDWITHGQFNPVSHTTSFGNKSVFINQDKLLHPTFSYSPKIDVPLKYVFKSEEAHPINKDVLVYSKHQFPQLLLVTPDSDDIWGTSWFKGTITPFGFIEDIECLKSPSLGTVTQSGDLLHATDLFIPAYLCGFPVSIQMYLVLEHYRD